jgi:acetylornithine/succinyldiaminopimelate/putrescine aminotransferase
MINARRSTRIVAQVTSPTAVPVSRAHQGSTSSASSLTPKSSTEFPRSWEKCTVAQVGAEGHYYLVEDGRRILDVSGGAAVSCFGPGYNERIADAVNKAHLKYGGYSCSASFTNRATQDFIDALVESTEGHMESALLYGSGESLSSLSPTL